MDGVLADMESELLRHAEALFGEALRSPSPKAGASAPKAPGASAGHAADPAPPEAAGDPPNPTSLENGASPESVPLPITPRQQRRLWRHVGGITNFWGTLAEIEPGVVARLGALAVERRWEIIFLTKRPETAGETAQMQTQRWLEAHGFPLPSVYVVQGSRGRIAAALGLDFVVDDRPENCLDVVVDSKARAILIWRDRSSKAPTATRRLGIGVVASVSDCLNILAEADTPRRDRLGVLDRVRRLLGLKESATDAPGPDATA
jgi:hypothetical protein